MQYQTDIGILEIEEQNNYIIKIGFLNSEKIELCKQYGQSETQLMKETYKQIVEYLEGKREKFDIPIKLKGTQFQLKVWEALQKIPYGETRSYQDIANEIGNPKACRAVGMANHNNPVAVIIPCHRVIGKNGKLTGYAGGLSIKEKLLEIEMN